MGIYLFLLNVEYNFYLSECRIRLNSIKYQNRLFFNIIFLLTINLIIFFMLKINILNVLKKLI